jgi:hypothetical protein
VIAALTGASCGDVELGSNVVWSDDFESGDLAAWEADSQGGQSAANEGSLVEVSDEIAHRGRFGLRLRADTEGTMGGTAAAFRRFESPEPAYYSAWFYVPTDTREVSWTIMTFDSIDPDDPDEPEKVWTGLSLKLRRLPTGELALYLFHSDRAYLQEPIAASPATAQIQRWFHVEARWVPSTEANGELAVWLDGAPVYRVTGRPTAHGPVLQFSVCNSARQLDPLTADLFVDDVVVSRDRMTPAGEL